jgi:ABC-type uncharacterized transport system substrate-binding protein
MCWDRLCFALFLLVFTGSTAQASDLGRQQPARILLVHSYDPQYSWCKNINDGVRQALRGLNVSVETVYLDAKRDPDPERLRARAKAVAERIEAEKPQVVIAADDTAQEYLVVPYLKGHATPQVIFCGVNAQLSRYGYPASNVSGARERWHFREGFALLKRIVPRLRSVTVLTDDSNTSRYLMDGLKEEAGHGSFALKITAVQEVHTFQQWRHLVAALQKKPGALALGLYHSLVDESTGKTVSSAEVMAWTNAMNHLPTLGFADFSKDYGILCGVVQSAQEQGLLAGGMTRQILEHGVAAGRLPVCINQKGIILLNLKTAARLNVQVPFEIINAAGVVLK